MALGRLCGLGEHSCRSTFSNANRKFKSKSAPPVGWYAIQKLFEMADSDVLLLLDCCAAASAAPADAESPSVTEIIAACGFETFAPLPGRHSFTDTLIVVLEEWKWRTSFTAAMLHCEILRRLRHERPEKRGNTDRKFECRKTPILIVSTNNPDARSIELFARRIASQIPKEVTPANAPNTGGASFPKFLPDAELDNNESPAVVSISEAADPIYQTDNLYNKDSLVKVLDNGDTALPHVIISVALEEEPHPTLDFELWRRWLEQLPALARYVKVQGVYNGTENWRWTGYSFVDTKTDGILADSDLKELQIDPIAAENLPTTPPIWCIREYWIKIFEFRIGYVRKEWLYLIGKLERSIDLYVRGISHILLITPLIV